MCRVLKVIVVAQRDEHTELRRRLSSLEYDIAATIEPGDDLEGTFDVALVMEPDEMVVGALRARGLKVVTVGGGAGADLELDDPDQFRSRVWELFRAR
jgi:hypothetical protein